MLRISRTSPNPQIPKNPNHVCPQNKDRKSCEADRQHLLTGYGTTELGYGTTNADAGVGIGLKRGFRNLIEKAMN